MSEKVDYIKTKLTSLPIRCG